MIYRFTITKGYPSKDYTDLEDAKEQFINEIATNDFEIEDETINP